MFLISSFLKHYSFYKLTCTVEHIRHLPNKYLSSDQLSYWVIVQLTILGENAEMRINGGPAIQVTVEGRNFVSSDRVAVGSVLAPDVTAVSMSMDVYTGYVGSLYEVTINDNDYLLRDAALSRHDVYVDSESTTLAGIHRLFPNTEGRCLFVCLFV